MEFHPNWTLFFNWTELANADVNDQQYLAECLHAVFTALAVVIGITGVISNVGLILSLIIVARTRRELSSQTKHLVISLVTADIFLLIFGLPYDLVAANDYPWLEGRIGCQLSAYLPEASRYAWMSTVVVLSLSDHWPAVFLKIRTFGPAARTKCLLVWLVSLAAAVPFAVHVDCHNLSDTETTSSDDDTCSCVLTVNQTEVVLLFGSSLIVLTILPVSALGHYVWKRSRSSGGSGPTSDSQLSSQRSTSSRTLAAMLLAFMGSTLPRYVYIVVNYSELLSTTANYELMTAIEILCCCLFYASSLIHLTLSPHPRWLFRQLVKRPCRQ